MSALADLRALLVEANEAKHEKDQDLAVVIWRAGRANALAQALALIERDAPAVPGADTDRTGRDE